MNTKKPNTQKCGINHDNFTPTNYKAEDKKNDVIVLPPDLLQKLGINLGKIQSPQDNSLQTNIGTCSKSEESNDFLRPDTSALKMETQSISKESTETSILETANLMKASVFLSPTFNRLKTDMLDKESNHLEIPVENVTTKHINDKKNDDENVCVKVNKFNSDIVKCATMQANNNEEDFCENGKERNIKPILSKVGDTLPIELSVLEDNMLEEDNSDVRESAVSQNTVIEVKNKVNIVSDEILEYKRFKSLKMLKSDTKNMLPTAIDTIISINNNAAKLKKPPSVIVDDQYPDSISDHKKHLHNVNFTIKENSVNVNKRLEEENCNSSTTCTDIALTNNVHVMLHLTELDTSNHTKVNKVYDDGMKNGELEFKNNHNIASKQSNLNIDKNLKLNVAIDEQESNHIKSLPEYTNIQSATMNDVDLSVNTVHTINSTKQRELTNKKNKCSNCKKEYESCKKTCKNYNSNDYEITSDIKRGSKHKQNLNNIDNKPSEANLSLGKVEELSYHLSQHFNTDQDRQYNKNKNITQSKGNPKLCVQGVEKPGGDMKTIHKNIKTYTRLKHVNDKKQTLLSIESGNAKNLKCIVDIDADLKIDNKILRPETKCLYNFCLCEDFGSFVYYDVDNCHEHIHFWNRREAECSVETLLSIYDDNYFDDKFMQENVNIPIIEETEEDIQLLISDNTEFNICWSYDINVNNELNPSKTKCFQAQNVNVSDSKNSAPKTNNDSINKLIEMEVNNDIQVDLSIANITPNDIGEKIIPCSTNAEVNISNAKKRKLIDDASENDAVCEIPKAKKTKHVVKCGVCNSKVLKQEWEAHISKKHCFIAWREDEEINFKNKDLLKKLNKRLCDTKKLTCTFCEREMCDVNKFIKHVKKCRKRKNAVITSEATEKCVKITTEVTPVLLKSEKNQATTIAMLQPPDKEQIVLPVEFEKKQVNEVLNVENDIKRANEQTKIKQIDIKNIVDENDLKRKPEEKQLIEKPFLQVESDEKQIAKETSIQVDTTENQVAKLEQESADTEVVEVFVVQEDTEDPEVTCGVCKKVFQDSLWVDHISQEHNYLAWKEDDVPLDCTDDGMVRDYLNYIIKEVGELVCKGCGLKRKFAKSYLKHIKICLNVEKPNEEIVDPEPPAPVEVVKTEKEEAENINIKCGVCHIELMSDQWDEHIFKEHEYMAWKEGEPEIDPNDSQQVYDCLFYLTKQNDGLICKKCGCRRRYVKSYLKHIKTCEGPQDVAQNNTFNVSANDSNAVNDTLDSTILDISDDEGGNVICGVCKVEMEGKRWLNHIQKQHAYLAWKEGKPALNLDDDQEIHNYLHLVSKKYNGLICNKCGINRKYVKVYLSHLQSCDFNLSDKFVISDGVLEKDSYECGVCAQVVDAKDWKDHAMEMHYNIAWVVGDYPIDLKNANVIEKLLKEYKKLQGSLKCKTCGTSRASHMGFYAHIIQCGKTEEEIDYFKIYCDLCDSKYLCIYKYQHALMHREQEISRERKLLVASHERESIDSIKTEHTERRRAAEKARQFIEKAESYAYNCSSCGYGADDQAELDMHVCGKMKYKDFSDSGDSMKVDSSDEESVDTAVDSNLSEEEEMGADRRRRRHGDSSSAATRVPRVPFTVKCAKSFLKQSASEYRKNFLTSQVLYPQWRPCNIDMVADDHLSKYLPTVKESCKVIIGRSEPTTFKQFEVKKGNGYTMFAGGCIQSISWAPPHVDDNNGDFGHYLAVTCHNEFDSPRLDYTKTYVHAGLIQIWDFGPLLSYPKFVMGIAHDYGTIWAIDWCPSGARDIWRSSETLSDDNSKPNTDTLLRLGLLAIACSNGFAYIFSVPYPATVITSDKYVYKLTPVAELRSSRGERDVVQATSISWSPQHGHATVMVGYSDGTTALYNLESDSPLLIDKEGDVNIFYPFHDERPHNSTVEDVKMFASTTIGGLISSVSPTGSETAQMQGKARVQGHLSSTSSSFAPHWPSLMVSGNETIVNQAVNELDWWGVGRRIGGVQHCSGCLHCGQMVTFAPPVLKVLTTHPTYSDFNKEPIAVLQMRLRGQKRTKHKNDELQVKLEPISYHDAVKMYALDFKLLKDLGRESFRQLNNSKEQHPERFPLSDITSMAFYPSTNHHRQLAIATHAGIIFIITV